VIFTFLLALLMFEVLMPKGFFKKLSFFAVILSLVVLVFLNFKTAWVITIVSALLVFVYKSSVERSLSKMFTKSVDEQDIDEKIAEADSQHFPLMAFISLLVGLFFFLSSGSIGAKPGKPCGCVIYRYSSFICHYYSRHACHTSTQSSLWRRCWSLRGHVESLSSSRYQRHSILEHFFRYWL